MEHTRKLHTWGGFLLLLVLLLHILVILGTSTGHTTDVLIILRLVHDLQIRRGSLKWQPADAVLIHLDPRPGVFSRDGNVGIFLRFNGKTLDITGRDAVIA